MAKPLTRNHAQAKALRQECLRRWLHGETMLEIGEALDIKKPTVFYHLQRARQEIATDRDEWLDKSLSRLEWIIKESFDAWEDSKRTVSPNSAFLCQALHAIRQQSNMLGLNAPNKIAPTNPTGTDEYAGSFGKLEVLINRTIVHSHEGPAEA